MKKGICNYNCVFFRFGANPAVINSNPSLDEGMTDHGEMRRDHVLSVSGKKKCSHCDEELGEWKVESDCCCIDN